MTPPDPQWRAWMYAVAWMAAGVASAALVVWLVTLLRYGWSKISEPQQIAILGNALYLSIAQMGLVTLGLTMRSAIRNIKGTAFGASVEASADKSEEQS